MTQSRWAHWSAGTEEKRTLSSFIAEQESPADMAKRMGLQSDGSGGYVDPNTGQVVARTVNNELVFYDPMGGAISAQSDGAELTQAQPSWVDPVTGELTVPPGQPESPEEISAVPDPVPAQAPAGYSAFMNATKKRMYADQGTPEQKAIDSIQQALDPQLGMEDEGMEEMPGKQFEEFVKEEIPVEPTQPTDTAPKPFVARSIAKGNTAAAPKVQKAAQIKDHDGDGDIDINDLKETARKSWNNWTTANINEQNRIDTKLQPALDALGKEGINPNHKNKIMHSLLNAYRYEGRDNEASSDLNKAEFHALRDNKQRIFDAYGGQGSDGSTHDLDSIRQFQKDINNTEMDDELIDASFGALSPTQRDIFSGGDMSARQGYGKYLRQGGNGGYTGLPLDYQTMQMEHFIDHTQARDLESKAKQEGRDMTPEEQELYDFIVGEENQFWARQGPNEQKSSRNPAQFFKERIDPLESLGDDFFDYRELTVDPARLDLKEQEKSMISHLLDTDGDGQISLSEMSQDDYTSHQNAVNDVYNNKKDSLLQGLTEAFDPNGLMKLGPKAFENRISNEESPISDNDRPLYDMLRTLQGKVKGYNPNFAYRLMQGLGLPTNFIQSERPRSQQISPPIYEAIASQLPGKSKEDQIEYISKVKELLTSSNSEANSMRGQGLKDADIRKVLYQKLLQGGVDGGIFSEDTIGSNPGLEKLINKYLTQNESLEEMLNVDEDEGTDIEDILEIIKELGLIQQYNQPKAQNKGLDFDSFRDRM